MKNLIAFVLPSPLAGARYHQCGWGNGYVAIPEGHPLFGMDYDAIHSKYPQIEVHYGLTYAGLQGDGDGLTDAPPEVNGMWVIGFDTAHYQDTLERWPKRMVELEAESLKKQIEEIEF